MAKKQYDGVASDVALTEVLGLESAGSSTDTLSNDEESQEEFDPILFIEEKHREGRLAIIEELLVFRHELIKKLEGELKGKLTKKYLNSVNDLWKSSKIAYLASAHERYSAFHVEKVGCYENLTRMELATPCAERNSFWMMTGLLSAFEKFDIELKNALQQLAQSNPWLANSIKQDLVDVNLAIDRQLVALKANSSIVQANRSITNVRGVLFSPANVQNAPANELTR